MENGDCKMCSTTAVLWSIFQTFQNSFFSEDLQLTALVRNSFEKLDARVVLFCTVASKLKSAVMGCNAKNLKML